jgi:hypothetical protein
VEPDLRVRKGTKYTSKERVQARHGENKSTCTGKGWQVMVTSAKHQKGYVAKRKGYGHYGQKERDGNRVMANITARVGLVCR